MSKGFRILLGVIAAGIAYVLLYPAVCRDPGLSREIHEMRSVKVAMTQYKAEYSCYPTGELDVVISTLAGENPRKIIFLDWYETPQDRSKKVVDPWGTPYRIQIAPDTVVVLCAGPDRNFGTSDDRSTK